jgi:mannose-6-phosphate isomerase-like protein (cupin superfamily)
MEPPDVRPVAVDLTALAHGPGVGAVWRLTDSPDLSVNLVRVGSGGEIGEHRNDEVDVVLVGVAGAAAVVVDGRSVPLRPGMLVWVPRGRRRAVRVADEPAAWLSLHRRRAGLQVGAGPPG